MRLIYGIKDSKILLAVVSRKSGLEVKTKEIINATNFKREKKPKFVSEKYGRSWAHRGECKEKPFKIAISSNSIIKPIVNRETYGKLKTNFFLK